ncbi:MAG: hypothetical protein ACFB9M_20200 [Myxococcota bacterium]
MPVANQAQAGPSRASPGASKLLSHHAIMILVAPFTRRGYRVDLAASDRAQGMLTFRAVEVPAVPGGHPALKSVLRLERPHRLKVRVIRRLEAADGQTATVTAEGDDPEALLDALERIEPARQFHVVEGSSLEANPPMITRSYGTEVWHTQPSRPGLWRARTAWPRLTKAEARLGPLHCAATDQEGRALEIRLTARKGTSLQLPTDFLAVLGWSWRPLRRMDRSTWVGSVRPWGWPSERTARLERQLDETVTHIVETLPASPALFHRRHRAARWRAAFQRALPLLFIIGMTLGITAAVYLLPKSHAVQMLLLYTSIAAIAGLKMMDKAWRVEIPKPPRPLSQTRWAPDA